MFEQIIQIRAILSNLNSNLKAITEENEKLRNEYTRLTKENLDLRKELENKETT